MSVRAAPTLATLAVAALAACATCPKPAPGAPVPPTVSIPGVVRPPAGQVLQRTLWATGVQVYECRAKAVGGGTPDWVFVAPEAALADDKGAPVGKHYAGPTWEANDGSRIVGTVAGKVESPDAGTIPWLLLSTRSTGPAGLFSNVAFVQRVATAGGAAPDGGCDAANLGRQARIDYKAQYAMYAPGS